MAQPGGRREPSVRDVLGDRPRRVRPTPAFGPYDADTRHGPGMTRHACRPGSSRLSSGTAAPRSPRRSPTVPASSRRSSGRLEVPARCIRRPVRRSRAVRCKWSALMHGDDRLLVLQQVVRGVADHRLRNRELVVVCTSMNTCRCRRGRGIASCACRRSRSPPRRPR